MLIAMFDNTNFTENEKYSDIKIKFSLFIFAVAELWI